MKKFAAALSTIALLFLAGCALSTARPTDAAPGMDSDIPDMGVAAPTPVFVPVGAVGVAPSAHVATPLSPELTVTPGFSGFATRQGMQDVISAEVTLAPSRHELEARRLLIRIDGLNGGRVRGSHGTAYLSDIKFKNLDTGATAMGPITIPDTVPPGATTTGMMAFAISDGFTMTPDSPVHLGLTFDTYAGLEDGSGEFVAHGGVDPTFRVWIGMEGSSLVSPSSVRIVETGEYLQPEQVSGDNTAGFSTFVVEPPPAPPPPPAPVPPMATGTSSIAISVTISDALFETFPDFGEILQVRFHDINGNPYWCEISPGMLTETPEIFSESPRGAAQHTAPRTFFCVLYNVPADVPFRFTTQLFMTLRSDSAGIIYWFYEFTDVSLYGEFDHCERTGGVHIEAYRCIPDPTGATVPCTPMGDNDSDPRLPTYINPEGGPGGWNICSYEVPPLSI